MSDPVEDELVDALDTLKGDYDEFEKSWGDR